MNLKSLYHISHLQDHSSLDHDHGMPPLSRPMIMVKGCSLFFQLILTGDSRHRLLRRLGAPPTGRLAPSSHDAQLHRHTCHTQPAHRPPWCTPYSERRLHDFFPSHISCQKRRRRADTYAQKCTIAHTHGRHRFGQRTGRTDVCHDWSRYPRAPFCSAAWRKG